MNDFNPYESPTSSRYVNPTKLDTPALIESRRRVHQILSFGLMLQGFCFLFAYNAFIWMLSTHGSEGVDFLLTSVGLAFGLFIAIMFYAYRMSARWWMLTEILLFGIPILFLMFIFVLGLL